MSIGKGPARNVTRHYGVARSATAADRLRESFGGDRIDLPSIRKTYFEHGYVQALLDIEDGKVKGYAPSADPEEKHDL